MNKVLEFQGSFRFLSNFYQAPVQLDGELYQSVEHAYQAAKTSDPQQRAQFRDSNITAGNAKRLGRKLNSRLDWENVKLDIMLSLLRQKFGKDNRDKWLLQRLLNTGDAELIEGNSWGDTFWGVCNGVGENHLGKLLMQVRKELKEDG